jgi:hypothetical protein
LYKAGPIKPSCYQLLGLTEKTSHARDSLQKGRGGEGRGEERRGEERRGERQGKPVLPVSR